MDWGVKWYKNFVKGLRLSEGFDDQADLSRGERAATGGVAVSSQALFKTGEMVNPLAQLAPCGIGSDVGTVTLPY